MADGTVVAVVSDTPDSVPGVVPTGLDLAGMGGNDVSIDIGDGVYAFYAHLVPGSPTVKVGDKVTRGQVIGQVGNSGNSREVHLHFQLQRTPTQASGDNVPFEIDSFTYAGSFAHETGFASARTPVPAPTRCPSPEHRRLPSRSVGSARQLRRDLDDGATNRRDEDRPVHARLRGRTSVVRSH